MSLNLETVSTHEFTSNPSLYSVDKTLIEDIAGKEIGDAWYLEAEHSYMKGNERLKGSPSAQVEILKARENFYGHQLGFANKTHPLNNLFNSFKHEPLPVPATFLASQKVLQLYGLNGVQVCRTKPQVSKLSPTHLAENLDLITSLGADPRGYQSVMLLTRSPNVIRDTLKPGSDSSMKNQGKSLDLGGYMSLSATTAEARKRRIARYAEVLAYVGDIEELSNDSLLLAYANTRLRLVARLLGTFAQDQVFDTKDIRNFMVRPIEAHFMTVMSAVPYTPQSVGASFKTLKTAEIRDSWMKESFPNREVMVKELGIKVVLAYEAHKSKEKIKSVAASQRNRSREPRFARTL